MAEKTSAVTLPSLQTAESIVKIVAGSADILLKLLSTFMPSHETAMKLKECEDKIKQSRFKKFNEDFHSKAIKGISIQKFQGFVARMQKTFELSEKEKQSLLDGLDIDENEGVLESFTFEDGKGKIYRGRFITTYKNEKIDVAYAIYTVNFELPKKNSNYWWSWLTGLLNRLLGHNAEAQALTSDQKDKLNEWCEAKMHHVARERSKESETSNGN